MSEVVVADVVWVGGAARLRVFLTSLRYESSDIVLLSGYALNDGAEDCLDIVDRVLNVGYIGMNGQIMEEASMLEHLTTDFFLQDAGPDVVDALFVELGSMAK